MYALPLYLKETTDFLNKLKDCHVDSNDFLCTMDVSSFYPNILHKDGLEATNYFWIKELNGIPLLSFCYL